MADIRSVYRGPVTALHYHPSSKCLFTGTGCTVAAYATTGPSGNVSGKKKKVFEFRVSGQGTAVRGFASRGDSVVAFGNRFMIWIVASKGDSGVSVSVHRVDYDLSDFPRAACFLSDDMCAVGYTHNYVELVSVHGASSERRRVLCGGNDSMSFLVSSMNIFMCGGDAIVATGTMFSEVVLWSATTGAIINVIKGHAGPINTTFFSLDNRNLATASDDRTVRVWKPAGESAPLQQLECIGTFYGSQGRVWSCSIAGDFVVGSGEDGTVRVWRASEKDSRRPCTMNWHIGKHAWSVCTWTREDGCHMLASGGNGGYVKMCCIEDAFSFSKGALKREISLGASKPLLHSVAIDKKMGFFVLKDGSIHVLESLADGVPKQVGHVPFAANVMQASPDGSFAVVCGTKGEVGLLRYGDAPKFEVCACFPEDTKIVEAFCARDCSEFVLTRNWKGTVRLWKVCESGLSALGVLVMPPPERSGKKYQHRIATSFDWDRNTELFVIGDECGGVHLCIKDGIVSSQLGAHGHSRVTGVAAVPSAGEVLSLGKDGSFCRWKNEKGSLSLLERRTCWKLMTGMEGIICADKPASVWGTMGNNLVVQSMEDCTHVLTMEMSSQRRDSDIRFCSELDESQLWASTRKGDSIVLTVPTTSGPLFRESVLQYGVHGMEVNCIKYCPALGVFITAGRDRMLRVLSCDFASGDARTEQEIFGHTSTVKGFSVYTRSGKSEEKSFLFSCGGNAELMAFGTERNECTGKTWFRALGKFLIKSVETLDSADGDDDDENENENESKLSCVDAFADECVANEGKCFVAVGSSDATLYLALFDCKKEAFCAEPPRKVSLDSIPLSIGHVQVGRFSYLVVGKNNGGYECFSVSPEFKSVCSVSGVHETGINSFDIAPHLEGATKSWELFGAGDDQAVSRALLEVVGGSSGGEGNGTLSFTGHQRLERADFSSITCLALCGDGTFVTSGLSQLVRRWKYEDGEIREVSSPVVTDVADVMSIATTADGAKTIAISGQGVQFFGL